jgi:hypothetical protein
VKGITGESFVLESLILPEGIPALCDDARLRSVNLATLPTLDECGVAVRQTDGRDPHRGIQISDAPVGGPQTAGVAPAPPPELLMPPPRPPLDKGKGAASSSSAQMALGCRRRRGDISYVAPTDRLFRTPPSRRG